MSESIANVSVVEIEVTPEMIEAGIDALASHYLNLSEGLAGFPEIVRTVFSAMVEARLKSDARGGQTL